MPAAAFNSACNCQRVDCVGVSVAAGAGIGVRVCDSNALTVPHCHSLANALSLNLTF